MGKHLAREKNKYKVKLARDHLAVNWNLTNQELGKMLRISHKTIGRWRNDPKFIESVYDRYMEMAGKELPDVITAMIGEAKLGNVRAAELVLKHFGKLQETLVVKVEAPFMQHLRASKLGEIEEAEIVEDFGPEAIGEAFEIPDRIADMMPIRDESNDTPFTVQRIDNERVAKITRETTDKKRKQNRAKTERKKRAKRAKELGMERLPAGRPSESIKSAWIKEFNKLDKKAKANGK